MQKTYILKHESEPLYISEKEYSLLVSVKNSVDATKWTFENAQGVKNYYKKEHGTDLKLIEVVEGDEI